MPKKLKIVMFLLLILVGLLATSSAQVVLADPIDACYSC